MTFFEDHGWVLMLLFIGGVAYWTIKNMVAQMRDYKEFRKQQKEEEENGNITE